MFALPSLPYAYDALSPVISDRTLRLHHDKHHAAYLKKLNDLIGSSGSAYPSLEALIIEAAKSSLKPLFNNAAQVWNHAFYWMAMSPDRQQVGSELESAIVSAFGSRSELRQKFVTSGAEHFGSGWVWLSANSAGTLKVISTHDAEDTLTSQDQTPLLVCDLWEHAYYLDYQNDRKAYLEAWFDALPNWRLAAAQLAAAQGRGQVWRYPAPDT